MSTRREAFLYDLRVLWDRGIHYKVEIAAALNIKVATLDQRIVRARKAGALPPAVPGSNLFDPFGVYIHISGWYPDARRYNTTTPKRRPPQNHQ